VRLVELVVPLLLLGPQTRVLRAQAHSGGGISSTSGGRVSIAYIREEWGPPDSVRLAAVVIWRGAGPYGATTSPAEGAAARILSDSASHESVRQQRWGGGTITPHANAWVEFDPRVRAVYVQGERLDVPARDSLVVVLVDDRDRVGGGARMQTRTLPGLASPDLVRAALEGRGRFMEASMAREEAWRAALEADPVVRNFLARAP
jgi:hypothetical protein